MISGRVRQLLFIAVAFAATGEVMAATAPVTPDGRVKSVNATPAPPIVDTSAAAASPGLRGTLSADQTPAAATPPAPTVFLPTVGQAYAGLSITGTSLAPITPLPSRTDPAPICREACAEARIGCLSNEGDCDAPWATCVAGCSAPQPGSGF